MKFGKQLVDEAHRAWAEHYIDYKALKQILKQLAPEARNDSQIEASAHPLLREATVRLHAHAKLHFWRQSSQWRGQCGAFHTRLKAGHCMPATHATQSLATMHSLSLLHLAPSRRGCA